MKISLDFYLNKKYTFQPFLQFNNYRNSMDITLRQVELFLALARTSRIQSVAKEFSLTQSAVSTAIKRFEEAIDAPLFDRAHKKISLNSNGNGLAEELIPLMRRFQDVSTMFKRNLIAGSLEIGASQTIADYILPEVLYTFQAHHHDTHLSIWTGNSREVVHAVEMGEVAVGFIEGEVPSRILQSEKIGEEELIVVTSDVDIAAERSWTMEELLDLRWILREPGSGTRHTFFDQLGEQAQKLNIFMELDHIESIKNVLRNPGTLSCLSQHCIAHELARGTLFPVQITGTHFMRNLYRVIHPRQSQTVLMNAVFNEVNKSLSAVQHMMKG